MSLGAGLKHVFRRQKDGDIIELSLSRKTLERVSSLNPVHKVAFVGARTPRKYIDKFRRNVVRGGC